MNLTTPSLLALACLLTACLEPFDEPIEAPAVASSEAPATASSEAPATPLAAIPVEGCRPPTSGALRTWFDGQDYELPLLHTDVDAHISGMVADVSVLQVFTNPFDVPIEAEYVFPLPEDAAVDGMTLRVGDRVIEATVHEKEEAKAIYERARSEGRVAARLDQERPNLFRQHVANLLPGESIEVDVHLVQPLEFEDGGYDFVFPLVVGPRFVPDAGSGETDLEEARAAVAAPYSSTRTGNDVAVHVEVDAGVDVTALHSPSHDIVLSEHTRGGVVDLAPGDTIPNRDFVLRYEVGGDVPEVALLAQADEHDSVFMLVIQPPAEAALTDAMVTPKEMVFVVDSSGSMSGFPMEKAKQAMRLAIDGMNPDDRFLVMDFNDSVSQLAPRPLPNTAANRRRGLEFVDAFRGSGGTRMLAGIEASLGLPPDPELLRTVVFLTDGYIGNEADILASIDQRLGSRTRLFSLGIGSSVNRYLLDSMAKAGRGDVEYVLHQEGADEAVAQLYERIRNPVVTDIELEFDGVAVHDVLPDPVPDLFSGQPLVLLGRYDEPGPLTVTVRGRTRSGPFAQEVTVDLPADGDDHPGLPSLWARQVVEDLETRNRGGGDAALNAELLELALHHGLVTRMTSMVAVDSVVSNPGGRAAKHEVALETPEGVDIEAAAGPAGPDGLHHTGQGPRTSCEFGAAESGMSGGLGGLGLMGVGAGGGGSAYGSGSGSLSSRSGGAYYGQKGGGAPGLGTGEPIVLGSIDKSVIDRIVKKHLPQIRYCYQKQLQRQPGLAGKVTVKFVIAADGTVSTTQVRSSTLGDETVESCVLERIGRMRFPSPRGGGVVVVSYPFVFAATEEKR